MKLLHKLAVLAAILIPAFGSLAQSESTSVGPVTLGGSGWASTFTVGEVSSVQNAAQGLQTMLGNILSYLVPVVGVIALAGVAIWAVPKIVGTVKSAFTSGKGR